MCSFLVLSFIEWNFDIFMMLFIFKWIYVFMQNGFIYLVENLNGHCQIIRNVQDLNFKSLRIRQTIRKYTQKYKRERYVDDDIAIYHPAKFLCCEKERSTYEAASRQQQNIVKAHTRVKTGFIQHSLCVCSGKILFSTRIQIF